MSATTSHRSARQGLGRSLALVFLAACNPLGAQILDWEAAIAEVGTGISSFTSVEARAADATGQTATALLAGNFTGNFQMGPTTGLGNPNGQDGIVVRAERDPAIPATWTIVRALQAASTNGNVAITDLAVRENGKFYVTGRFSEDVSFAPGGPSFSAPGFTAGFVAWGDTNVFPPTWDGAFETPGLEAESIALGPGPDPDIYLTGPGVLARKYDRVSIEPNGGEKWSTPAPAGTSTLTDIAVHADPNGPDQDNPDLYVLAESPGIPNGVILYQLTGANGSATWQRRMGGQGDEFAGGLAVPSDGHPRVAFTTQDSVPTFGPDPIPGLPSINAGHALMLRINPGGNLVWATPLGRAQDPGSAMRPNDVAVDAYGNAFAAAGFTGAFLIESGAPEVGDNDTAVLGVDPTGILFDFHRSTGGGIENPLAISAPVRDLVVMVGDYDRTENPPNQQSIFGSFTLPPVTAGEPHGFFVVAGPIPGQERLILAPEPGAQTPPTLPELIEIVHQLGGQVHNVIPRAPGGGVLAAYIDAEDIPDLQGDPAIKLELDHAVRPAGTNADSGWALEHLNDATNASTAPYSFTYSEPGHPVYLYLLDTAVGSADPVQQADISTWFGANTSLTLGGTTLVRGVGDPLVSSLFQHGTEMLSLIGGPSAGAAVGTPIVLKNFDFYPTGAGTTASLLASAIYDAIDYHDANGDCFPGLIVIASSSVAAASSTTLSNAIDEAIAEGLPVILSAGNSNANAGLYVPASKGSVSGAICVGASKADRTRVGTSNFGAPGANDPPVDLYAPGDSVRVIDYSAPLGGSYGSFTGTSASAAITGAVAATYLSVNPWSTPADLETALSGDVYTDGSSGLDILQLAATGPGFYLEYDDWAAWFGLTDTSHAGDDDGDGWTNLEEFFHGLKPSKFDQMGSQVAISYDHSTSKATFSFSISSVLLDPDNLGTLLDGTTYEVTDSTTLASFATSGASLTVGSSTGGQTTLSQTESASTECYLRVEYSPASPSP